MSAQKDEALSNVTFPSWFYLGMLGSAGWPKTTGLRRRLIVNKTVADMLAEQLGEIGRITGASNSDVGLRLLQSNFASRDWTDEKLRAMADLLESEHSIGWTALAPAGTDVPWEVITSEPFHVRLQMWFAAELWHGLINADLAMSSANAELLGATERAQDAAVHGLDVDATQMPTSADQLGKDTAQLITSYEEEVGRPPPAPTSLIDFARVMGHEAH